jgi:hypothetical protein
LLISLGTKPDNPHKKRWRKDLEITDDTFEFLRRSDLQDQKINSIDQENSKQRSRNYQENKWKKSTDAFPDPDSNSAGNVIGITSLETWITTCNSRASTNVLSLTGLGSMIRLSRTSINTEVKSEINSTDVSVKM